MKKAKIVLLIILNTIFTSLLSGCWNYKEIEQLAIVSGVTVDKAGKDKVLLTTEIVKVNQDPKQASLIPVYIEAYGETFFDAVRSMIALEGKKMYWSHAKAVIISEDIAKSGVSRVLDFINRDAEVREDMWVLLSKEKTASMILTSKPKIETITCFEIDDTLRAQRSISRFPSIELYEFLDELTSKESAAIIPTVKLNKNVGETTFYITGAAIIARDKLLGYLSETDVRNLLWIQDKFGGGLYIVKDVGETKTNVTLEIFKSKTKIKPEVQDDKLVIKVKLSIEVNIAEIMGKEDVISENGRALLKKEAEEQIKKDIESMIEKAQRKYKTDILGFGKRIKRSMPGTWRTIENQWDEIFPKIETDVEVEVRIRGSATTRKPIKVGD